jgi:predicted PurR-regulated permease PerM
VSSALVPFGIGLVIVLLLRRPVELLSRRMNRLLAVLVCYATVLVVVGIALTFVIPPAYAQIVQFVDAVPSYAQQAYKLWAEFVARPQAAGVPTWLQSAVIALKDQIVAGAGSWSSAIAASAVSAGSAIASGLVALVLSFIVGFYTLVDLPGIQHEVNLLAGERFRAETSHATATVTRVLGGWLRGTLIQSTVVAILFSLGLWAAGVPYALAIGIIGGMFNVVPYVGPVATALLAAGAGLFVTPWTALWAIVIVFAVQQIDSMILAPRIMSEQVDLHPLFVILSLLVGATLFGVGGMVLSVPVAAVIKGLFVYWFEKRTERTLATDEGALFRTTKDAAAPSDDAPPSAGGAERG